ncbi:MAG: 23S rRNA (adenine(2503)-C(2))-methyltransferase RlmN [Thermodesulfobacteriota bacterium]
MTIDLRNLTQQQLIEFCRTIGLPDYRGRQIFAWLYRRHVCSFDQMTDLPKDLRQKLAELARIGTLAIAEVKTSRDGTRKFAFRLDDGLLVESVLIPEGDRQTLCISSQAGCTMGCRFCMTGCGGFRRNLAAAEIVGQVIAIADLLDSEHAPALSNLVFMGMGEPLANFTNLLAALDILIDQRGLDFSERRVTVSTCGIVPKMAELGRATRVNLAVSLHAADDATRSLLMPVNTTWPLAELMEACRTFPKPRRKRIMMEYILIRGINDAPEHAGKLAKLLRGVPCKINLLRYNPIPSLPFEGPDQETVDRFQDILWKAGYTVIVRNSRGGDIDAACGQLAGQLSGLAENDEEFPGDPPG